MNLKSMEMISKFLSRVVTLHLLKIQQQPINFTRRFYSKMSRQKVLVTRGDIPESGLSILKNKYVY